MTVADVSSFLQHVFLKALT